MGARNPDRIPRLHSLAGSCPPGWVRLAVCLECRYAAPLPVAALIKRFGELVPIEQALMALRCTACGRKTVAHKMVRLCEPGCPRQR